MRTKTKSYRQKKSLAAKLEEGPVGVTQSQATFFSPYSEARACCLNADAFDLLDELPTGSVDLVITSPPYWGLRTYGLNHNWSIDREWLSAGHSIEEIPAYTWYRQHGGVLGLEPTPEWFVAHLVEFFQKLARPLKAGGSMWINLGDTYFARWSSIRPNGRQGLGRDERFRRRTPMGGFRQEKNLLLIPSRFAIAMQEKKWILRNDVIWHKPNVPPRPDDDRLRLSHEHFFHFVKRPKQGRASYYYDLTQVEDGARDVITHYVRPGSGGHSATFPAEIIRPRIRSSCPVNGVVLDPFCGTGRSLVVALHSGRRAFGIELSKQFHSTALDAVTAAAVPDLSCLMQSANGMVTG